MRRLLALLAAVGISVATVAVAAPALAQNFGNNVFCTGSSIITSLSPTTGDTITMTQISGSCQYFSVPKGVIASTTDVALTASGSTTGPTDMGTYWQWTVGGSDQITQAVVTVTASGSGQMSLNEGTGSYIGLYINIGTNSGGGGSSSGTTSNQTPPSHLQQVGIPASGDCSDVEDADLSWGTGLSGGWVKAWGEWLNGGNWVCSRTLQYSTAQSRWVTA